MTNNSDISYSGGDMGGLIAILRRERGLTQKELGEYLGVSDKAVSRWERGECAPDISILAPLATLLGVSCDELIAGTRIQACAEKALTDTYPSAEYSESESATTGSLTSHAGSSFATPANDGCAKHANSDTSKHITPTHIWQRLVISLALSAAAVIIMALCVYSLSSSALGLCVSLLMIAAGWVMLGHSCVTAHESGCQNIRSAMHRAISHALPAGLISAAFCSVLAFAREDSMSYYGQWQTDTLSVGSWLAYIVPCTALCLAFVTAVGWLLRRRWADRAQSRICTRTALIMLCLLVVQGTFNIAFSDACLLTKGRHFTNVHDYISYMETFADGSDEYHLIRRGLLFTTRNYSISYGEDVTTLSSDDEIPEGYELHEYKGVSFLLPSTSFLTDTVTDYDGTQYQFTYRNMATAGQYIRTNSGRFSVRVYTLYDAMTGLAIRYYINYLTFWVYIIVFAVAHRRMRKANRLNTTSRANQTVCS